MSIPKNLTELLAPYPYFFKATESDNKDILEFFRSITMDTKAFSLRYDRGDDFFKFAKEQSDNNLNFIIRDEKKIVRGTASISFITHYYQGKKEVFGYLGDLRISPHLNAKIRIHWKKCYSEIIEHFQSLEEFNGVKYLYTAILDENQNAMRSLLKNNDQLIYHKLTHYLAFNVLQERFLDRFKKNHYKIEPVSFDKASHFLKNDISHTGLAPYYSPGADSELNRHVREWDGFSESKVECVQDPKTGKLLATFAPWICKSKKLVIEKMNTRQKILSLISPLLGIPSLREKDSINVLYLTHLHFEKNLLAHEKNMILHDILRSLLRRKNRSFHVISFLLFPEWEDTSLSMMAEITKAQFFQVMNKNQFEARDFIDLNNEPPAFEIGIA